MIETELTTRAKSTETFPARCLMEPALLESLCIIYIIVRNMAAALMSERSNPDRQLRFRMALGFKALPR